MAHDWPGNIRELENAIEHAFIRCNSGQICISHLSEDLTAQSAIEGVDSNILPAHNILDVQAILAALVSFPKLDGRSEKVSTVADMHPQQRTQ